MNKQLIVDVEDARRHWGHNIVIAFYGNDRMGNHLSCSLECDDCFECLADVDLTKWL